MRKILLSVFLLVTSMTSLAAMEPFTVADIRVDGLQRISVKTVFKALPINVGQQVDEALIARSIKELFATGSFHDIQMARDGDVLIITVAERPSISSIEIEGNKILDTDNLLDGLAQSGMSEGSVFQRATLDKIKLDLQRQYVAQGRYGAQVITEVVPQPRNRVALKIKIYEGKVATIVHINIVGNESFTEEQLLGLFELKVDPFWPFSSKDKYAREKLSGDLETLRSFYMDRGYINFNIESTQVSITPDKKHVYITVNITEGDIYSVNEVKLAGEIPVNELLIQALLVVKKGQTFSRQLVTMTSDLITKRLGNEGYTFAEVNGVPEINEEDKTVNVTFFVNPGKRVYVRRINFIGNEKTRDEVLRREMRQMEGAWASSHKIEMSKKRLERLGFFKGVTVDTPRVPGSDDQIDVTMTVEEQPSGSIGASVGYQDGTGVIFGANVSQNNFLGTGNKVAFSLNRTDLRNSYSFTFNNPYYTVDGVSRGFGMFFTETDYSNTNTTTYRTDVWGANVNYGYPINENERLGLSFGVDNTTIYAFLFSTSLIKDFVDYYTEERLAFDFNNDPIIDTDTGLQATYTVGVPPTQNRDVLSYTVTGSWLRSTLNKGIFADRGASQRLALEVALPGSELEYFKLTYRGERYFPLSKQFTLRLRTELGYGGGYGDVDALPFYKHFFAGGFGSVRGYDARSLGPIDRFEVNDFSSSPFGGNFLTEGSAEFIFPVPFAKDKRSVRTLFFVDGGNVFDLQRKDEFNMDKDASELRFSAGVGLSWLTGIGPLTFTIAKPINEQPGDRTQSFEFTLGQAL